MKQLLDIFIATSLAMIFASAAAAAQTDKRKLNPAEKWVATQVTATQCSGCET
jgi:hypothetical protein